MATHRTAPATPESSCAWKSADPKLKLLVLTYSGGMPGEMMFPGAHQGAVNAAGAKPTDESGIGDKAFSVTAAFGASFIMPKGGRMLQVQFWTGAHGTEKDRDVLPGVARKVVAAF